MEMKDHKWTLGHDHAYASVKYRLDSNALLYPDFVAYGQKFQKYPQKSIKNFIYCILPDLQENTTPDEQLLMMMALLKPVDSTVAEVMMIMTNNDCYYCIQPSFGMYNLVISL